MKISSRVNATNLTARQSAERSTPDLHPRLEENRQLNPRSRALRRVAVGVPPREHKAPGENARKFTYSRGGEGRTGERGVALKDRTERGRGGGQRDPPAIALWLAPFFVSLLLPSHHGVISCKALLSRCGNFIFATNLRPPLPRPLVSSRRLVLCPVTLRFLTRARESFSLLFPSPHPFGSLC